MRNRGGLTDTRANSDATMGAPSILRLIGHSCSLQGGALQCHAVVSVPKRAHNTTVL